MASSTAKVTRRRAPPRQISPAQKLTAVPIVAAQAAAHHRVEEWHGGASTSSRGRTPLGLGTAATPCAPWTGWASTC
eukprot:1546441-Pyramimonas_sp.AAC.1